MAKLSLKKIIESSRYALASLKRNELRSAFSILNKRMKKISKDFAKHGKLDELEKRYRKVNVNPNKMSNEELLNAIGDYSEFLNNKVNSYSKWRAEYRKGKKRYADMIGKKRVTDAEYDRYRDYMAEMYELHKNSIEPSDLYNESNDIWILSTRLNLNPMQFTENFEKWSKRLEKLNEKIDDASIIKGEELDLEVYAKSFKKVASWIQED